MTLKSEGTPHEKRRGTLNNGNPPGDFSMAPRCGARNRRGSPCQCPAMRNGRCRLHGGLSTGGEDLGGYRAHSVRRDEAREVLEAGYCGTKVLSGPSAGVSGDAGNNLAMT